MAKKYVFDFTEGGVGDVALLGIKGGNLAQMTQMGIPVPVGFNITTEACRKVIENDGELPTDMLEQILRAVKRIEREIGLTLGDGDSPLLFSMRTGASVKMKGLAKTVLNIGLNDEIASRIVRATKNLVFGWDLYCRFIRDYATIVAGLNYDEYREAENKIRIENAGIPEPEMLQKIISQFKKMYKKDTKTAFPQDVRTQLIEAIKAGLNSWNSEQARSYRRINNIDDNLGCAVSVQAMVYGNYDMESGVGVAHTRNIMNGENEISGEFIRRSQDKNMLAQKVTYDMAELKKENPPVYLELKDCCRKLEHFFQDVMTIEFCLQSNKVYIMQVETAKRTPEASVRAAVEMANEHILNRKLAIQRVKPSSINTLLQPTFDADRESYARVLAEGLCAYPGCASGVIALTSAMALSYAGEGKRVILIRESTNAQDTEGIAAACGLITLTGGATCHAALAARKKSLPCITSCKRLSINENTHTIKLGGMNYHEGDTISLDATRGVVFGEALPLTEPKLKGNLGTLIEWSRASANIPIYADAETPAKVKRALELGAVGVGLVRTENMFFTEDRLAAMRKFLLAPDKKLKENSLKTMQKGHTADFVALFSAIGDRTVNVRLMDPPFHKFLPSSQNTLRAIARDLNLNYESIREAADTLMQSSPQLGVRGARLLILFPELVEMQVTAVINAAIEVRRRTKKMPNINFVVPLVSIVPEFESISRQIRRIANNLLEKVKFAFPYQIGCMIETPRACLIADKIAETADFICFGTNDLTQFTFGFSRDDSSKFLREYYADSLIYSDPFFTLDPHGVFDLLEIATKLVREVKPKMPIWLLGEPASDPDSLRLTRSLNLTAVSVAPNKVPACILAQAQTKE